MAEARSAWFSNSVKLQVPIWLFYSFCVSCDTLFYLFLPVLYLEFNLTLAELGVLLAINRVLRIGIRLAGVSLFFRQKAITLINFCFVCTAASVALYLIGIEQTNTFWTLLAGRVLWGLGFVGLSSLLDVTTGKQTSAKSRAIGLRTSVTLLMPVAFLTCAALLGAQHYYAYVTLAALFGVVLTWLVARAAAWDQDGVATPKAGTFRGLVSPEAVILFSLECASNFLIVDLAPNLVRLGVTDTPLVALAVAMILVRLSPLLLSPIYASVSRRMPPRTALSVVIIGVILLLVFDSAVGALAFVIVFSMLCSLIITECFLIANEANDVQDRAANSASFRLAQELGKGFGPLLLLVSGDLIHDWIGVAVGSIVVLALVKLLRDTFWK